MIRHNDKNISSVYFGKKVIEKIYKGTLLVYEAFKKLIASGVPPITLQKCKNANLVDYKIYGESVQNGTPTYATPIEIESVGEKTKNILNISKYPARKGYYTDTGGALNTGNANFTALTPIPVEPNTQYTFSSNLSLYTIWYATASSFGGQYVISKIFTSKFTTPNECKYIYVSLRGELSTFEWAMLEIGEGDKIYEPYGYKIPVTVRSKNLFDAQEYFPDYVNDENGITYTNKEFSKIYAKQILKGEFKENTRYTVSLEYEITNSDSNGINIDFRNDTGARITAVYKQSITGSESGKIILTNPVNTTISYVSISYGTSSRVCNVKLKNIQIEENTSATDFEQYFEGITNIYLNEPLRKIGDYADYIDFENKKVYRKISKKIFDGTENFSRFTSSNTNYFRIQLANFKYVPYSNVNLGYNGLSNCYSVVPATLRNDKTLSAGSTDCCTYDFGNNNFTTAGEFKTHLMELYKGDNPLELCIVSANPTEEPIELPNIPLNKGTNIIEVDTNILPSNIEIKYYGETNILLLNEEENIVLNDILSDNTETEKDITDTEIIQILDEIIGG